MAEPHIEALMLRLLIASAKRDNESFCSALDETLTSDRRAGDVIAALCLRAADSAMRLSEATLLMVGTRPLDEARAELAERLEWRLLQTLEEMSADQ